MSTVTISSKFQVVIPKDVREKHDIRAGQEVQVFYYDGRIEIIPLQNMKKMRGIARGIDTDISRKGDRF
jgi:AbrB family looped-hinge helix DNA binding protein